MNRLLYISLIVLIGSLNAFASDTLTIDSKIEKVVVFLEGAQVKRKATCELQKGENIINFSKLTSHADEKSLQVKSVEHVAIQSINFTINHLDSLERKHKISLLKKELDSLEERTKIVNSRIYVLDQEQELLNANRTFSGEKRIITTAELKEASVYYRQQLSNIVKLKIAETTKLKQIDDRKLIINNQLTELNAKSAKPVGEVWVVVYAQKAGSAEFFIEYFVKDAGWKAKYDIRSESVSKPAILSYKADVYQNTDDDWTNVEMVLSSSNPSLSGTKPQLEGWILNMETEYRYSGYDVLSSGGGGSSYGRSSYSSSSTYSNSVGYYQGIKNDYSNPIEVSTTMTISGTVIDETGGGLPGVNIMLEGTAIGTITDLDGNYQIEVPAGTQYIVFSFVGYNSEKLPITGTTVNCSLALDACGLEECVVVGYGTARKSEALGAITTLGADDLVPARGIGISGSSSTSGSISLKGLFTRKKKPIKKTLVGLNEVKENQTSVEFILDKPYTIPSDNNNYSVDIEKYEIPVDYQFSTVPKIDESAFLLAEMTEWEELHLLSGKVNIYYQGAFVGNSELDVHQTNDTISFSMGCDKGIVIERKLEKDKAKNNMLSKWKVEEFYWKITVKNTKNEDVNLLVEDQVPVSYQKGVSIEVLDDSGADYHEKKGEMKWKLTLKPLEKRILTLAYRVKTKKT